MIRDPIVEEVRRVRLEIEKESGGIEGVLNRYAGMVARPGHGRRPTRKAAQTPQQRRQMLAHA